MKTIVFSNHKGGAAKTTTAFNVAIILAAQGSRVLAVDMDPQGNLSIGFGANLEELEINRRTSHRMMLEMNTDISHYLLRARPRLDYIPSCVDFDAKALVETYNISRDLLLRNALAQVSRAYDYCVIDTAPNLDAPTINALAMSDMTIIPVDSSHFALVGLRQMLKTLTAVRRAYVPKMMFMGLSTKYKPRGIVDRGIREQLQTIFKTNLFDTFIPDAAAVEKATAIGKAVIETEVQSPAAMAFFNLTNEIRERFNHEKVGPEFIGGEVDSLSSTLANTESNKA
jgi:chromosome partitioning protein